MLMRNGFMLTVRTEVTDRMLIFGQRHLQTVLAEYESRYNGRRPHRSRQLRPPRPDHPVADLSKERSQRRPVLGGLVSEYGRAAWKPGLEPVAESWNPAGSPLTGLDTGLLTSYGTFRIRTNRVSGHHMTGMIRPIARGSPGRATRACRVYLPGAATPGSGVAVKVLPGS